MVHFSIPRSDRRPDIFARRIEPSIFDAIVNLAKAGMTITLFLIGASLSPETLRNVGVRPLIQGVILWIVISVVSLFAVFRLL